MRHCVVGITFCEKCGATDTPNGKDKSDISRCLLVQINRTAVNNSIFECDCREGYFGNGLKCEGMCLQMLSCDFFDELFVYTRNVI